MSSNSELRTIGLGFCWQDYTVGDRFQTIGRSISEADLVSFINTTGMTEVMFNNLVYIEEHSAVRGGRAVPGALAYAIAEGLLVQSTMQHTGLAFLHMELDVKGPTFVDDTLHVEVEVLEVRQTSKGNRGLVRTRNEVKNQDGKTVIVYTPLRMVAGREE